MCLYIYTCSECGFGQDLCGHISNISMYTHTHTHMHICIYKITLTYIHIFTEYIYIYLNRYSECGFGRGSTLQSTQFQLPEGPARIPNNHKPIRMYMNINTYSECGFGPDVYIYINVHTNVLHISLLAKPKGVLTLCV